MQTRWWNWLLGTYAIITIWFVGSPVLYDASVRVFGDGESWQRLVAELSTFVPFFLATPLVWRYLLKRDVRELINMAGVVRRRRIAFGFGVWLALSLISTGIDYALNADTYRWTFESSRFLPFLLAAVLLLPMQTSAEEFFFRGWILRWADASPTAAKVVLSGVVFALPHLGNPEAAGHEFAALAAWFILGAGWAYVSVRDRGIELALGAHFANNVFSILVVGYDNAALPTSALATTSALDIEGTAIGLAIAMLLFIGLTRPRK